MFTAYSVLQETDTRVKLYERRRALAHMREGGRAGMGSKPWTTRKEVPTRALNAFPNTLLATRGDPKVMHRTSASGYSSADHAAPAEVTPCFPDEVTSQAFSASCI